MQYDPACPSDMAAMARQYDKGFDPPEDEPCRLKRLLELTGIKYHMIEMKEDEEHETIRDRY